MTLYQNVELRPWDACLDAAWKCGVDMVPPAGTITISHKYVRKGSLSQRCNCETGRVHYPGPSADGRISEDDCVGRCAENTAKGHVCQVQTENGTLHLLFEKLVTGSHALQGLRRDNCFISLESDSLRLHTEQKSCTFILARFCGEKQSINLFDQQTSFSNLVHRSYASNSSSHMECSLP